MFRCELIALEYPEPDSFNVSGNTKLICYHIHKL